MKKVMFHLNTLERGGMERVVVNLAGQFADNGYDTIVATEWKGEVEYPLSEKVKRIHVGLGKEDESKGRFAKINIRNRNLKRAIKEEEPDIVFAFEKKAIYRALIAAKGTGSAVVLAVRMNPKDNYASPVDRLLTAFLYRRAKGAVFQTEVMRDFFPKWVGEKSTLIVNPLNKELLNCEKAATRSKRIVSVARFIELKNQLLLVKAFEKIKDKYPEYTVEFYGEESDGDGYYQRVKDYVDSHNLTDRVIFKGLEQNVYEAIKDAAVFALTSDTEGLPNSLMEAMALGIPAISTDFESGGAKALIKNNENGILVPVGDETSLAKAIEFILDNPEKAEMLADNAMKITKIANPDAVFKAWESYGLKITGE
jgi:glycosyltransferase involved in cell wall biosynthesis